MTRTVWTTARTLGARRWVVLIALPLLASCRTLTLNQIRPTFETNERLDLKCVALESNPRDGSLEQAARPLYQDGWRLMSVGTKVTTFLFFQVSEQMVMCFERIPPTGCAAPDKPKTEASAPSPPSP